MFAIGHFALGYLTGKSTSKVFKTKLNLPLLLVASVLPDIDLILQAVNPTIFMHRGPTHSIITITVLMIPFFLFYKKQAAPYYVALLSHSLIGDLFTGGIEMLWPLSQNWFSYLNISVESLPNIIAELLLFAVTTPIMYKTGDLKKILHPKKYKLALIVAFGAILGPTIEMRYGSEGVLPALLLAPSIFWLIMFAYSMLLSLRTKNEKATQAKANPLHAG